MYVFQHPQVLQAWHLMCVAGIITGVGVLLILAKTIAQTFTSPQLIVDGENPNGLTVSCIAINLHSTASFYII